MALFRFNHYGSTKNKFLWDIVLVLSKRNRFFIRRCAKFVGHVRCPTVISHYATALGNLPIAVNGLPLVPIGNDMRDTTSQTNLIPYYPKILKSIKNE